jgi:hypothetical protein
MRIPPPFLPSASQAGSQRQSYSPPCRYGTGQSACFRPPPTPDPGTCRRPTEPAALRCNSRITIICMAAARASPCEGRTDYLFCALSYSHTPGGPSMSLPSTGRAGVTGSSAGSTPACRAGWPAACCSAATSSSIPGPRNSPPRPAATAGARVFPPAAASHWRMPDSGGTAEGNDQDQQFDVQDYAILPRSQVIAGTSASVACRGSFVDGFCLLAVPQSLELNRPAPVTQGTGTRVLPFRKSLHKARSRTRISIRVPVQSRPMGPIRPASHQHRRCGSGPYRLPAAGPVRRDGARARETWDA